MNLHPEHPEGTFIAPVRDGSEARSVIDEVTGDAVVKAEIRSWIENVVVPALVDRFIRRALPSKCYPGREEP